jgi:hypothetical protein
LLTYAAKAKISARSAVVDGKIVLWRAEADEEDDD